jgi:lipopolysaccharide O-acetyltransferase
MTRFKQLVRDNGFYLGSNILWNIARTRIHSRCLAWKLGVQQLSVPPDAMIRGLRFIELGENVCAGRGLWLEAVSRYQGVDYTPRIVIGDNAAMSHYVHIAATNLVQIGSNVLFGSKVLVTDHHHGDYQLAHSSPHQPPIQRTLTSHLSTIIEDNVWLGDGVVVMPGVTIGYGCIIGANSVVTRDIPPFTIAAGVPAVALKTFDFASHQWRKL